MQEIALFSQTEDNMEVRTTHCAHFQDSRALSTVQKYLPCILL